MSLPALGRPQPRLLAARGLFFGFGFLVLPVLPGAASFFGRFGDTGSLLPWVRIRSEAALRTEPYDIQNATAAPDDLAEAIFVYARANIDTSARSVCRQHHPRGG